LIDYDTILKFKLGLKLVQSTCKMTSVFTTYKSMIRETFLELYIQTYKLFGKIFKMTLN